MIRYIDAVRELVGGSIGGLSDGPLNQLKFCSGQNPPTEEEIQTKLAELRAAEPMRLLREERDRRITETDWWAGQDLTMTQEQKDYRQALRDLPSVAEPQLDENGQLTNVTWPTKPE